MAAHQPPLQAQRALLAETSFRRAMENSMLIGLRALDLNGRITYVNPAFCRMTGWSESALVGRVPPFPYWPPNDQQEMQKQIDLTLQGKSPATGYEMRVMRRDGSSFFARMYVSPLVDGRGRHTGWMSSMTDITRAQARPRGAGCRTRPLHDRAGKPGRRRLRAGHPTRPSCCSPAATTGNCSAGRPRGT